MRVVVAPSLVLVLAFPFLQAGNADAASCLPPYLESSSTHIRPTQGSSRVAIGDLNGDGIPDIAVTSFKSSDVVTFLALPSGGLAPGTAYASGGQGSGGVDVGDIDGDGDLDVVVANYTSNNISIFRGNGQGGLSPAELVPTGRGPTDVKIDSFHDVFVSSYLENLVQQFRLTGSRTQGRAPAAHVAVASYPCGEGPNAMALGDPEGNGRLRLVTANFIGDSLTHFERDPSTGSWSRKAETSLAGAHPAAVTFCDADGDRRLDLLAAGQQSNNVYIVGLAGGVVAALPSGGVNPSGCLCLDYDRDGIKDLLVSHQTSGGIMGLGGKGALVFGPPIPLASQTVNGLAPWMSGGGDDYIACSRGSDSSVTVYRTACACPVIEPEGYTIHAFSTASGGFVREDPPQPRGEREIEVSASPWFTGTVYRVYSMAGDVAIPLPVSSSDVTWYVRSRFRSSCGGASRWFGSTFVQVARAVIQIASVTFGQRVRPGERGRVGTFGLLNTGGKPAAVSFTGSGGMEPGLAAMTLDPGALQYLNISGLFQQAGTHFGGIIGSYTPVAGGRSVNIPVFGLATVDTFTGYFPGLLFMNPNPVILRRGQTTDVEFSWDSSNPPSGRALGLNVIGNAYGIGFPPVIPPFTGEAPPPFLTFEAKGITFDEFLGEDPNGTWTLEAIDLDPATTNGGQLEEWGLSLDGESSVFRKADPARMKSTDPRPAFVIPSAVSAAGSGGLVVFQSDGWLTNHGAEEVRARLSYTPDGASGLDEAAVRETDLLLAPGRTLRLSHLVDLIFDTSGSGQVRVAAERPGLLSLRTVVEATTGKVRSTKYGTEIPVVAASSGVAAGGGDLVVPGVDEDATNRANVILAETSGAEVEAEIRVLGSDGAEVGRLRRTIPPWGKVQVNRVVDAVSPGRTLSGGSVRVSAASGTGTVTALATVIDNASNSFSAVSGRRPAGTVLAGTRLIVPGVARLKGAFETQFVASLAITNGGSETASLSLTYRYLDTASGETRSATQGVTLPPGGSLPKVMGQDVILALFGVESPSYGWIEITGDVGYVVGGSAVSARVDPTDPSKGLKTAAIDAFLSSSPGVARLGDPERSFAGIEKSPLRRTNLIVVEVDGKPVSVRVRARSAGGNRLAERVFEAGAHQYLQINDVLGTLTGAEGPFFDVSIGVQVESGGGRVVSFATVNDNISRNPEIFMLRLPGPPLE